MKTTDKGFTLIELLIVIVILGTLATIVVFAVGGVTEKGQGSACQADRESLTVAVEAYFAKAGHYPSAQTELITTGPYKFLRSASTNYDITGTQGALQGAGECV